jgi:type II secretory pathway component GspD/PulD (secretin)
VSKFRLTALENQQSRLQFGEHVPLVTGRNVFGGGREGRPQVGATYSQTAVGTMISAVARVEDGGAVLAELKFERSSVAPRPAEAAEADPAAPQGTTTVSVQTSIRLNPGEPLLVGGRQTGGKEASQTWIVLTASVAAGGAKPAVAEPKPAAAAAIDEQFKILSIVNASAPELAAVLSQIFQREPVRIAVDVRTNSLLLRGSPDTLEIMRNVVLRLDIEE